jgi:TonB family protein
VHCVECETYPLTPGHYCECCGRKLSLMERGELESAPVTVGADHDAPGHRAAPVARCGSCGTPCADGDLCETCQQAFVPVLRSTTPASNSTSEIAKLNPVKTEAAKAESARAVAASVVADWAAAAKTENVHRAKAPYPAVVSTRPVVSGQSRRTRSTLFAAATLAIIAAIGVLQGARWLGIYPQAVRDRQSAQLTPVAEGATATERRTTPPGTRSGTKGSTKGHPSSTTLPHAAVSARLKPTTQVAPVVAPSEATQAPAPVAAALETAESRQSIAAAAPTGRFFERKDVDESPQVATRVEPQVPADLPTRKDVVVVRVLVSQDGHPFRISLLRASRLGRSLDDAVVAAVTQWTFSPARRRGEAVSCWYNIGVPLGQAN